MLVKIHIAITIINNRITTANNTWAVVIFAAAKYDNCIDTV